MKSLIKISIIIILCCFFQAGCAYLSEKFNPYQNVIFLEQSIDTLDESTLQTLRNKLISDLHKPQSTATDIIKHSSFEIWDVEVGRYWYTEKGKIPYRIKMKTVVWRSEDYFSLVDIPDVDMLSLDKNFDFKFGENQRAWKDTTFLKIVPINDSIPVIVGMGGTFINKDTDEELGPYKVLCNFTLSGFNEYKY